jgi:putative ABC transport system permease protein
VFALALLITGISASFHNEVGRVVNAFHADNWVIAKNASGPFTSSVLIPVSAVDELRSKNPDVTAAAPIAILRFTVKTSRLRDINIIGAVPGSIGVPKVADGRAPAQSGEILADRALGVSVGKRLTIAGKQFTVVGRTSGFSYFAGTPAVVMTLKDAQDLFLHSVPFASAIVVRGTVSNPPAGMHAVTNAQAIKDLRRPLESATGTITILQVLLWIVAAGIIGSVLYLQAIERTRDFAVFKATGVKSSSLVSGMALQAIILAILAAAVAIILGYLLAPTMPMTVSIPTSTFYVLPIVAVIVGLISSVSGLRRAVHVDPALAFGG